MSEFQWILLLSQLPSSPSSVRVMLWRRMRSAGAVSLHNGVWALPFSVKNEQFAGEIHAYVDAHGGTSSVFNAKALTADVEQELIREFAKNIDQDYIEFVDKCGEFFREMEHETAQKKFTFAALDENEAELQKMVSWFRKIRARDYLGSEKIPQANAALENCRNILRVFARSVYSNEGIEVSESDLYKED